jgi:hypothetical protein
MLEEKVAGRLGGAAGRNGTPGKPHECGLRLGGGPRRLCCEPRGSAATEAL